MIMTKGNSTLKYHGMMVFLIIVWGLEFSIARGALEYVNAMVLLNTKYLLGALFIAVIALRTKKARLPEKQDLPLIFVTTFVGHILYYCGVYTAMETIPVANITVILGFLPLGSVLVEKILFQKRMSRVLVLLMVGCVAGIFMTIGADWVSLMAGKWSGYLMCLMALISWLAYLFLTGQLTEKYGAMNIALYQTTLAFLMTAPVMAPHLGEIPQLPPVIILQMIYLGVVNEGLCFLIEVTGLDRLGPTVSAVYSNFLPVTTAFFGWLILGQNLGPLQCAGGAIVIICGFFIIRERERLGVNG